MKKLFVFTILLLFCLVTFSANDAYKIKIKFNGLKDTTCFLGNYYGDKQYYKDTARVDSKGYCVFDGSEPLKAGIYSVIINNTLLFELVVNEPLIEIETDTANYVKKLVVLKSEENKLFYKQLFFVADKQVRTVELQKEISDSTISSLAKSEAKKEMEKIADEIKEYRLQMIKSNPKTFVAKILTAMKEPDVPEFSEIKNDSIQRVEKYFYNKNHYWDEFDFTDSRMVRTPIYHSKLDRFFNKIIVQNPDSIIHEADIIIAKTKSDSDMFKFTVHYITNNFEKSKIMGMESVFIHMGLKYYTHELATWLDSAQIEKIRERAKVMEPLQIGKKAINLSLMDTSGHWQNFYSLKTDYTILVFWDTECGHCKKEIPQLVQYYKTIKDQSVSVFTVNQNNEDSWKKFIKENNMDFVNVGVPVEVYTDQNKVNEYVLSGKTDVKSLNFHITYDIFSTPQIYLLDKNKTIIAKKLDIGLLKQVLETRYNIK